MSLRRAKCFDEAELRLMQRVFDELVFMVDDHQRADLAAAVYSATLKCQTFEAMVQAVCLELRLRLDQPRFLN